MHKIFLYPKNFWNIEGMPTKVFGTVRPKIFDGKTWYPLLCIKFFYTPNFLKHWRDAQEIFRHCETKNFRRKILKLPPSPPLIHKHFFATGHFLFSETQIILYEIFRNCETKKLWQKIVILPPPPLLSINFFDTRNFVKQRRVPLRSFLLQWDNKFSMENRDIPLLGIKFFDTRNFLKQRRVPIRSFSALWDQKFSTEKRGTPFLSIKLFEHKNFLKNSRIPLQKFSALWDIKISTENRDKPPLIHNFFSIPGIFRKTEGFLYKAFGFGPVRQKISTKPWCPPPLYENFR